MHAKTVKKKAMNLKKSEEGYMGLERGNRKEKYHN